MIVSAVAFLLRLLVSYGPHSGYRSPPMFGDYEAQRHWMELTVNLPVVQWYRNTSDNDLLYWGLDYPPLTAYHSYVMGHIAKRINTSWVTLNESRGEESNHHRIFMRWTVLLSDALTLMPGLLLLSRLKVSIIDSDLKRRMIQILMLCYPGLLLVDHGHFQYNCVSLGLFVWAVISADAFHYEVSSILFCAALSYKQLELYHALPFFCYFLGYCLRGGQLKIRLLLQIATTVITTMFLIWLPFLRSLDDVIAVVYRLFPFDRGLFEDKVANVWCTVSVFIKLKHLFAISTLLRICTMCTLLSCLPSCLMLLRCPDRRQFKLSLTITSLSFFLFSYHVHEKGILLAVIPSFFILGYLDFIASCAFLLVSAVCLHPLAVKDHTQLAFFALTIGYWSLLSYWIVPVFVHLQTANNRLKFVLYNVVVAIGLIICAISNILSPPLRYPDIFSLLISMYCCFCFVMFLLHVYYVQYCSYRVSLSSAKSTKKKL